eukprot:gnl/TRDRNA2_/TRDRNA2_176842_c0_seq5.p1 gnl/TRDRNA2_/TRDRNA2_176842_c0~~gnl/TRDRNA2_/TRDRNA2_176842_c0_seq5.p1  ORF type:complete len:247 (-),score=23.52 gnl/TRDRNA2_/TRDRNA2_176842_c0_seq5:33-773(-)
MLHKATMIVAAAQSCAADGLLESDSVEMCMRLSYWLRFCANYERTVHEHLWATDTSKLWDTCPEVMLGISVSRHVMELDALKVGGAAEATDISLLVRVQDLWLKVESAVKRLLLQHFVNFTQYFDPFPMIGFSPFCHISRFVSALQKKLHLLPRSVASHENRVYEHRVYEIAPGKWYLGYYLDRAETVRTNRREQLALSKRMKAVRQQLASDEAVGPQIVDNLGQDLPSGPGSKGISPSSSSASKL